MDGIVRHKSVFIFILFLFVLTSCNEKKVGEEEMIDPLVFLTNKIQMERFVSDSVMVEKEFILPIDSCLVQQSFEVYGDDEQWLRLQFFPKNDSSLVKIQSVISHWVSSKWNIEPCQSNYCSTYIKSGNGKDLEISFYNESEVKKIPYLALDFLEKDGIAE